MDFDSLKKVGAMVGSGGLVVMNKDTCMVSVARFFMQFTQSESAASACSCREGTKQMLALLDDIIEGRATEETLEILEDLAEMVQKGSLCGLGKTAPNPVLSTLRHFRDEYEAHVKHKYCPTGKCKALTQIRDRRGALQRVHALRQEMPGGRHLGREREDPSASTRRSAPSAGPACKAASFRQ